MNKKRDDNTIEEVISMMFSVSRLLRRRDLASNSKSFLELETMKRIADKGSLTMKELASYLAIRAPSVTALTDALVADGAVRREHSFADRRIIRISLTKKGKTELKKQYAGRAVHFRKALKTLGIDERAHLKEILRSIERALAAQ